MHSVNHSVPLCLLYHPVLLWNIKFAYKYFTLQQFDKAVEDVKNLKETPSNDDLLEIYALFKQATVGDCDTSKLNSPALFAKQLIVDNI